MKTVIEMAREAGIHVYPEFEEAFERFAALVIANHPPQSYMTWQEGYEAGKQAEREACAKVCANGVDTEHPTVKGHIMKDFGASSLLAAAIRARGETK